MSLKKAALTGMLWSFIQQMSTQGISFIVSLILARILLPEDFGLIAMLGVIIAIGNVMIDSGLGKSLIRTEDPDQEDFSAVFYFNLTISLVMYGVMYFSAPYVADFYKQPRLVGITRVYSLVFIINSFAIIQNTLLAKDLNFKRQTVITIPSLIVSSVVGIFMALNGYGVWSLVWSAITKSLFLSVQLWIWSPWKPIFKFNINKMKHHFNFGYKLTLAAIIDTLFSNIYTIIIGRFFNPMEVGFYNRANTLRQFPVKNFSTVLSKVTFPIFSKIQNDNVRLKNAYKKIMLMAVFLISPTLFLMSALAEPLFRFLLTEKWLPSVPYFQILCFNGVLYPIHAYNLNILTVKGRTDLFLKLEIIKKTLIILVVLVTFHWGIYGLLYGSLGISLFSLVLNTYYTGKFINYKLIEQLKDLLPTIILAGLISFGVYLIDFYIINAYTNSDLIRLILGSVLGLITFGFASYFFKMDSFNEIRLIINSKNK